jgi:hypothetical protein
MDYLPVAGNVCAVTEALILEHVANFDLALGRALAERFPDEPLAVPHRVWALIARAPA